MKKYIIKIVLFFAIVALVDMLYGKVGDYLQDHAKSGYAAKINYIIEESEDDIVMMGSSRMHHHYVPQIFEDSTGMTCYNAGVDGNGIILFYGLTRIMVERHAPKMIVYDISGFDLYKDDNSKYLDYIKPYYWDKHNCISGIFDDVDKMEKWKMFSSLYRYNSKLFQLLGDNYRSSETNNKGYMPIFHNIDYEPTPPTEEDAKREVDSLKINYLLMLSSLAKENNIDLIFASSPTYYGKLKVMDNAPMRELSEKMDLTYLDFYYDSLICNNKSYWAHGVHLNDEGARAFTESFVRAIRE